MNASARTYIQCHTYIHAPINNTHALRYVYARTCGHRGIFCTVQETYACKVCTRTHTYLNINMHVYTHSRGPPSSWRFIYAYKAYKICLGWMPTIKLIAFELAGEDRERRETPVVSRLRLSKSDGLTRCINVVERDFPLASRILRRTQTQTALYEILWPNFFSVIHACLNMWPCSRVRSSRVLDLICM
jgi:hypothetical protein